MLSYVLSCVCQRGYRAPLQKSQSIANLTDTLHKIMMTKLHAEDSSYVTEHEEVEPVLN